MRVREIPEGYGLTKAYVFCKNTYAGTLERTRDGACFSYDSDYLALSEKAAPSIASSIPKTRMDHSIKGVNLPPFFANLLPEGWVLKAVAERTKVAKDDLLSLLVAIGLDTIGDVWLDWSREPEIPIKKEWDLAAKTFQEILLEQYGAASNSLEAVSIPGVQEKISANRITITQVRAKGRPAIIKLNLNPEKYPCLIENEHFFMNMAGACGIAVPRVKIIFDSAGNKGLWVERFDRKLLPSGDILRLHQEDICQILELFPGDKYNLSARDAMEAIREICPAWRAELVSFLRLYAFCYLIGNGDLHGKNISVLESETGLKSLSPGYDLLTTLPYPVDKSMAMKIMGKDSGLKGKTFLEFAKLFDIPAPAIRAMLEKLIIKASPYAEKLGAIGFDKKAERHIASEMAIRLKGLAEF